MQEPFMCHYGIEQDWDGSDLEMVWFEWRGKLYFAAGWPTLKELARWLVCRHVPTHIVSWVVDDVERCRIGREVL